MLTAFALREDFVPNPDENGVETNPDAFHAGGVTLPTGRYVPIKAEDFHGGTLLAVEDQKLVDVLAEFFPLKRVDASNLADHPSFRLDDDGEVVANDASVILGPPAEEDAPAARAELEELGVRKLSYLAKERGLPVRRGMSKDDLIDMLVVPDEASANEAAGAGNPITPSPGEPGNDQTTGGEPGSDQPAGDGGESQEG